MLDKIRMQIAKELMSEFIVLVGSIFEGLKISRHKKDVILKVPVIVI